MEVLRERNPEGAAQRVAHELASDIADALSTRGAAHVALSGGRTPRHAYGLLAALVPSWKGVHVWFADERCVDPSDPEANVRLVRETLVAPEATIHRMQGELGAEAAAAAYDRELADVVLDVVLLGMGEDGHTASLFPGNPALHPAGDPRAVPVHDSPKPPPDRVSLSLATINAARRRLLLVTGADKAPALAAALGEPTDSVPASLLERDGLDVIADADALA